MTELASGDGRARLVLPDGWETLPPPAPDTTAALEPADDARPAEAEEGFRSNLVLTTSPQEATSFRDWQVATDELLPRMLTDYLLLDLEKCDVAGHPGGRRLAHHVTPDGTAVTMEQWFAVVSGVGYTLTATVDSWRYDEQADALAAVAAGLQIAAAGETP
jgi:hypothetical protein